MFDTLFAAVAEAVFNLLLQESGLTERVRAVLRIDPERHGFQIALARACTDFTQQHPAWAAALFDQHFLTQPEVVELLSRLLARRGQPDPARMAALWAAQLHRADPTHHAQAATVAADFLRMLEAELDARPELRALSESRDIAAVKDNTDTIAAEITALRRDFAEALRLLQAALAALPALPATPKPSLAGVIERFISGVYTPADLDLLREALRAGQIAIATGERAVSLGGSADGAVIVTGDHNRIIILQGHAATVARELTASPPNPPAVYPPNPFTPLSGRITDPTRIFGRQREVQQALDYLRSGSSVAFIGDSGVGKSSLLTLLKERAETELGRTPILLDMQKLHSEDDYYQALCEEAGIATVKGGWKLERALRGRRLLLLLDEIEKMTWDGFSHNLRAELRGLAEGECAPFKLVLVARSPLDRLFPDSELNTSPLAGICQQINVKPWNNATARTFIQQRLSGTPVHFSDGEIELLVRSSNGLPLRLMQSAFNLYRTKTSGDV
ncbi:AAA family ATPase [Roseiflexus sp. RS-1]|uniref:AAA family ATPase n=1 Tax=Roseiflexus sp. (strain RS-1) TaxID=357808 RepID=UPI0000D81A34|nr:AAA family ATPase [Roseiflexus sp. RS-1]